ncbi:MAG: hypothetical protein ACR2HH_15870 [Chthoniobacterales bacterium]
MAEEEKKQSDHSEDQLSFFSADELPRIDRSQREFNCTGERLFRDREDIYKLAVRLLAEPGLSWKQIMQTCHLGYRTLVAVAEREQIPVQQHKTIILGSIRRGLRLCAERVEECAPNATMKDALIGVGILTEKHSLLSGDATAILEIQHSPGDNFAAYNNHLAKVKALAREKMADARVIESDSEIGQPAENAEQMVEVLPS